MIGYTIVVNPNIISERAKHCFDSAYKGLLKCFAPGDRLFILDGKLTTVSGSCLTKIFGVTRLVNITTNTEVNVKSFEARWALLTASHVNGMEENRESFFTLISKDNDENYTC